MKISQKLAGLSLAASLFLAPILSTAQAQQFAGKPSAVTPSVIGGAPITIAVYNYTGTPVTPYWVTPAGALQPVPGSGPIPPMSGSTPATLQSFRGATLVFKGPAKGTGAGGKHFGGTNPAPFIVLGNPPPGAALPPALNKGSGSSPTATTPPAPPAPGKPGTTVNKSVVNKTVTNNPPPAAPEAPAAPGKGRKRVVNKAPDVNVTINTPPSDAPAAPSTEAPAPVAPASPTAPAPATAKNDEPESDLKALTADDPQVVEFLRIHNAARADVGVSPLAWSDDLAFTAQDWADRIGRTGKIQHRPKSEYGENLGWGTGDYTAASAANAWLAEKAKYSPDAAAKPAPKKKGKAAAKADAADEAAHYTQMIWGKSTMVGFGLATTKDGKTVVVANYNPRGNIEGEKPFEK